MLRFWHLRRKCWIRQIPARNSTQTAATHSYFSSHLIKVGQQQQQVFLPVIQSRLPSAEHSFVIIISSPPPPPPSCLCVPPPSAFRLVPLFSASLTAAALSIRFAHHQLGGRLSLNNQAKNIYISLILISRFVFWSVWASTPHFLRRRLLVRYALSDLSSVRFWFFDSQFFDFNLLNFLISLSSRSYQQEVPELEKNEQKWRIAKKANKL